MRIVKQERLPHSQIKLSVQAEEKDLQQAEEWALTQMAQSAKVSGFRPGKAPLTLIKRELDPKSLASKTFSALVDKLAAQTVQQENFQLVSQPRPDLTEEELKGLQGMLLTFVQQNQLPPELQVPLIKFIFSLKPEVNLGDYKKALVGIKTDEEEKILDALTETVQVDPPPDLITHEANQRLYQLMLQAQKIGLTFEEYLKQKKLSLEGLREAHKAEAEKTVKLRFILPALAEEFKRPLEKQEDFEYILGKLKKISQGD